jgi:hypothetical protein
VFGPVNVALLVLALLLLLCGLGILGKHSTAKVCPAHSLTAGRIAIGIGVASLIAGTVFGVLALAQP